VVLIDYPGFNWWIARRAHFHRIPVIYFVPPQLWGWAGWRVKKMQRFVDHVLCTLPFEVDWYRQRGVMAYHVGHPFFDEVQQQQLDVEFLARQRADGRPIIGILPGSRGQELDRNLLSQLRAAAKLHQTQPGVKFLAACFKPTHRALVNKLAGKFPGLPLEVHVGKTPEIIELAQACVSVSGSVSLELLHRAKPTVIVYRIRPFELMVARRFMTTRFITLVNLLAGRELFPEYLSEKCEAAAVAGHLHHWLTNPAEHARRVAELVELRQRVGVPGACARVADFLFEVAIPARAA
jgi:lipid-A-disaccharide synthase